MTISSSRPADDDTTPQAKGVPPDDTSEATAPTSFIYPKIEQEMVTKVLKFSFSPPTQKDSKLPHPSIIHTHWMHALQTTLGDEAIIWNNKGDKVDAINLIRWTGNPTMHQKQFTLHQKTSSSNGTLRTTRYYIVHRIITSASITSIKQIPEIQKILYDNNCYLNEHHWTEDEWDTNKIGFLTKLDPSFYTPEQAQMKFTNLLKTKVKNLHTRQRIKIPQFRMVFSSPKIRSQQNQTISTKAYSIEVQKKDAIPMFQVLKSLFRETLTFVPFSMSKKFPEGFKKAIKYQTQHLTSTRTIILEYLTPDMMFHIEEHIKAIDGVIDIMPDRRALINGKFRIQVTQESFHSARATLQKNLEKWCSEQIPIDAYPNPNPFPDQPKVQSIHKDGFSSGENSWMSTSNASFMSMDLSQVVDDDYFGNNVTTRTVFTYAEIVSPQPQRHSRTSIAEKVKATDTHIEDDSTKATVSELTNTENTKFDNINTQELETARRTIENQQSEIKRLKEEQSKYEKMFASMQAQIQDQTDENKNIKHEVQGIIQKQHEIHAANMHELYERMMAQMARMLLPLQPQTHLLSSPAHPQAAINTNHALNDNPLSEHQESKRQDTRPSPMKRKPTPLIPADQEQALSTIEHNLMDVERGTPPPIEDDV